MRGRRTVVSLSLAGSPSHRDYTICVYISFVPDVRTPEPNESFRSSHFISRQDRYEHTVDPTQRYIWWRHHLEQICSLLALCVENPPITIRFTAGFSSQTDWFKGASNTELWCFSLLLALARCLRNGRDTGDVSTMLPIWRYLWVKTNILIVFGWRRTP